MHYCKYDKLRSLFNKIVAPVGVEPTVARVKVRSVTNYAMGQCSRGGRIRTYVDHEDHDIQSVIPLTARKHP